MNEDIIFNEWERQKNPYWIDGKKIQIGHPDPVGEKGEDGSKYLAKISEPSIFEIKTNPYR